MRSLLKQFSQSLFPNHCLLCDLDCDEKFICKNCFDTLPIYEKNKTILNPPSIDHVFTLFHYVTPISSLIWKLKFQGDLSIAQLFAQYWINYFKNDVTPNALPDLIMPVPLHYARLKERGFNQALEIAKPIGQYFHIPIDTRTCIKIKNTRAQSSLSAEKRKHNLKNAFGLSYSVDAKHIAIVDDVMTTGNTVSEIAQLLKKVGVEKVDVWCCARTPQKIIFPNILPSLNVSPDSFAAPLDSFP